jgi:hypothetical protein
MVSLFAQEPAPVPGHLLKWGSDTVLSKNDTSVYTELVSKGKVDMGKVDARSVEKAVFYWTSLLPAGRDGNVLRYDARERGIKYSVYVYVEDSGIRIESETFYGYPASQDHTIGVKINLAINLMWQIAVALEKGNECPDISGQCREQRGQTLAKIHQNASRLLRGVFWPSPNV